MLYHHFLKPPGGFLRKRLVIVVLVGLSVALGCSSSKPVTYHLKPMPEPYIPKQARTAPGPERVVIHPRTEWADAPPKTSLLDPMGKPYRITVHHEGYHSGSMNASSVCAHLRRIRTVQMRPKGVDGGLGAGDIGYHYIIDQNGGIWEGRPMKYQGAHAGDFWRNKGNIGICVLGDYNDQLVPARARCSLKDLTVMLMARYHIPATKIYTHRELKPTECPGRNLQAYVNDLRGQLRLAK